MKSFANDKLNNAIQEESIAKIKYEKIEEELRSKRHEEDVIKCAKIYKELKECQGKITQYKQSIEDRENNSENAQQLACLKYSTFKNAQNKKNKVTEQITQENKLLNSAKDKLQNLQSELKTDKEAKEAAEHRYRIKEAEFKTAVKNTDNRIKSLNIDILRNLAGLYIAEDVDKIIKNKEKELIKYQNSSIEEENKINEETESMILKKIEERNEAKKDKTIGSINKRFFIILLSVLWDNL